MDAMEEVKMKKGQSSSAVVCLLSNQQRKWDGRHKKMAKDTR